jgi:hypothetical protein
MNTPGVFNFNGAVCYYNINVDTFMWIRSLCLLDKLWFTRQKEHEYIGHTKDGDEQLWYIHDDLMELIVDDEEDIFPQILPDLFLNEEQSDAPSVVDETRNVKHDILRLLDDLHKIATTCVTMLLKKEDK